MGAPFNSAYFKSHPLPHPLQTGTLNPSWPVLHAALRRSGKSVFYESLLHGSVLALVLGKDEVNGIVNLSVNLGIQAVMLRTCKTPGRVM